MNLAIVAAIAYGVLALVGGLVGYARAKSNISLVSGVLSGLLLLLGAMVQLQGQNWGLSLTTLVSAVLVVVFSVRLAKTRKFMPSGLMAIAGMATLAILLYQQFASV